MIKQFNKECDICIDDNIANLLLPFSKDIIKLENAQKRYDLVVCLDSSNITRVGNVKIQFIKAKKTINIDHHDTNTEYADLNIVEPQASSTCEILYNICLQYYNVIIDFNMANLAYAGIITDTNALMSNDINSSTFKAIADIIDRGLEIDTTKNYFFKSFSKAKLQLLGRALNSINFYNSNKTAVMIISQNDFNYCGATFNDTLGIVDFALRCYLTEIAVAIIEQDSDKYYVSLRSKKANISEIAKKYKGGGHNTVAAFQYSGNLNEFLDDLVNECTNVL